MNIISTETVQDCPGQLPPNGAGEADHSGNNVNMCAMMIVSIVCPNHHADDSHAAAEDGSQVSSRVLSGPSREVHTTSLVPRLPLQKGNPGGNVYSCGGMLNSEPKKDC